MDIVVVVVGCAAILCLCAAFALAFRPSDFRRHRAGNPKLRRPDRTGAGYVHSSVVMPPNHTPAASELRWPLPPRSPGDPPAPVDRP